MASVSAGIKAEREGLKASERSDAAVRDAADKVLHVSDKSGRKADRKSGGFFSKIGNWLSDRQVVLLASLSPASKSKEIPCAALLVLSSFQA